MLVENEAAGDGILNDGNGVVSREKSSAVLSRETLVASVDTELRTLAADDVVDEAASIDERLCFEGLRRSMLRGPDAAPSPGLRLLLGVGVAVVDVDVEDDVDVDDDEIDVGVSVAALVATAVVVAAPAGAVGDREVVSLGADEATQRRPKKREAAVVTSASAEACAVSAPR